MNTLLWFVILYWVISVGIGLYAARYVNSSSDFALAGRSLPMYVVTATVFATWFGSETVLGIPATFLKEGLSGVVSDPFGSSLCLVFVGLFFARKLYRMNLLTIGDFYKQRYGRAVEVLVTICIVISYLGWVAAQIKALGLIFNIVTDGAISQEAGMILGTAIVLTYTTFGGMLSVAILDFVQMGIIMGGMLFIAWFISGQTGGVHAVIEHAEAAGKLDFFFVADSLAFNGGSLRTTADVTLSANQGLTLNVNGTGTLAPATGTMLTVNGVIASGTGTGSTGGKLALGSTNGGTIVLAAPGLRQAIPASATAIRSVASAGVFR